MSQTNLYSIRGKRIESDEEVPVLGFKDNVAVVLQKQKTQPKQVIVQTDILSGKKFILVNGKRVEVKEIVKVKKAVDKSLGLKVVLMNKPEQKSNKKSTDVETSTDNLIEMKSVSVQTDFEEQQQQPPPPPTQSPKEVPQSFQIDFGEDNSGYIIGEDVRMGNGPKCPSPRIYHYCEQYVSPVKNTTGTLLSGKPLTRKEQILQLIQQDYKECVKYDECGHMPIHTAVIENNVDMVTRQCVALKYKESTVNKTTVVSHLTPLQLAILYEADVSIVEVLLQYGADPSILDKEGNNVIHLAVMHSKEYILEALLKHVDHFVLEIFNYEGLTPLMICCCNNKVKMAEMLLEKNVDPNVCDQKSGRTALFHAVEGNYVQIVQLLLKYKADPKQKNFVGQSAHDAVFEIEDVDNRITSLVLGRGPPLPNGKPKTKRKIPQEKPTGVKLTMERRYERCYLNSKVRVLSGKP